jgi:RHS repeat-associated protein
MLVQKTTGTVGSIKLKVSKSLINNPQAIRFTISTYNPNVMSNPDSLWQGGSVASDVFPGTKETFGGEINGYGEITPIGSKEVKDYTIYYVYDGINPIVEYSPNGSVLARYVYAGGRHIAKIAGADTHWYHCDALGSPRKMTREDGDTVWSALYYPFGETNTSGKADNTHDFTGKEYDSEMGLNYFCQRYYDPQIGRFITLDPFGGYTEVPQTQNRYVYCMNNPLKYIDPLGLKNQIDIVRDIGWDEINQCYWMPAIIVTPNGVYWPTDLYYPGYGNDGSYDYPEPGGGGKRGGGPGPGSGSSRKGGQRKDESPVIFGFQFQAQATFLWWGMSWGQTYIFTPTAERGWYFFMESNKGFGLGIGLGPILAWGSGPIAGDMADLSIGGGPMLVSVFDNGSMQAIFFGYNYGIPITFSSGLMTTEEMDSLDWP